MRGNSLKHLFLFFFFCHMAWGILVPQPKIEPEASCIGSAESEPQDCPGKSPSLPWWWCCYSVFQFYLIHNAYYCINLA